MIVTWMRRVAVMCLVVAALAGTFVRAAEETIPQPMELISKDVAGYVIAPNVNKLLDSIEAIAKKFAPPGQFQPGMVKMALGAQLGDPTLASVADKPAVLVLYKFPADYKPDGTAPAMSFLLPVTDVKPFEEALNQHNETMAYEDGILTIAPNKDGLKRAASFKADYAKIAGMKFDTGVRAYVNVASLMETFGPVLDMSVMMGIGAFAAQVKNNPAPPGIKMDPALITKFAKMGGKGLLGFLHQTDGLQMDVNVTPETLTISEVFYAKDGTVLASLWPNAPSGVADKNVEALLEKGAMMGVYNMNMAGMADGFTKLLAEIAKDPEFGEFAKEPGVQTMIDAMTASTGNGIFSAKVTAEGAVESKSAVGVRDAKKYDAVFDAMAKMMSADSAIGKLYAGMGMTFDAKVEKNVRQQKGVAVNRMTMDIQMPAAPPDAQERMKKMMKPTESAIVKNYFLSSNSNDGINTLIDKVSSGDFSPTGAVLKSKAAFGPGRQFYLDYDVFGVLKGVMAADPNNPAAAIFGKLPAGDPILMSFTTDKGRLRVEYQLPLDSFAAMMKSIQAITQGIQNGAPKPKTTDDGKF